MDSAQLDHLNTLLEDLRRADGEFRTHLEQILGVQETQAGMIASLGAPLKQLAAALASLAARVDELAAKVDLITDVQRQTDSRLNVIISTVDDLIRRRGPS